MDAAHLEGLPLFAGLSESARRFVASHADEVDVPAGKELIHEQGFAYEFFVIEEGTATVTRDGAHLADLGPGEHFGEMGTMTDARRNARVVATTPVTAIVMTSQDLRSIAREIPEVATRLRDTIGQRATRMN